jgi:hypothetical protein
LAITGVQHEFTKQRESHATEAREIREVLRREESENMAEIESLVRQRAQLGEWHTEKLQKLRAELKEVRLSQKNEIARTRHLTATARAENESALTALRAQSEEEASAARNQIAESEEGMRTRLRVCEFALADAKSRNCAAIETLAKERKDARDAHEGQLRLLREAIEKELEDAAAQLSAARRKNAARESKARVLSRKRGAELESLQLQHDRAVSVHSESLSRVADEEFSECSVLTAGFDQARVACQAAQTNALSSMASFEAQAIQARREQYSRETAELAGNLRNHAVQRLVEVSEECAGGAEDDAAVRALADEWASLDAALTAIECPVVSESATLRALDSEIQRLEAARGESKSSIAAERAAADADWRERLTAEAGRHAQCDVRPSSQRGRLQLLQSLRASIQEVRDSAASLSDALRAELTTAAASHDCAMVGLVELKAAPPDTAPALLASERDAAAVAWRETAAVDARARAEVSDAQRAAATVPREWEPEIAAIRERHAALDAEFALRAAPLEAALAAAAAATAAAWASGLEAEQQLYGAACAQLRQAHEARIAEFVQPLAEARAELTALAEAQARERARRRTLSDYDLTSSARELSAAHCELQACADAILAFYEEREAVLRANLSALKAKLRGGRDCDAQAIQRLTRDLNAAAAELARLQQCRGAN